MPAPTYVLIADFSSLVMRPPYIRSRLALIESVIDGIRQDGIRDKRSLFLFDRRISALRDRRYRIVKHCPQESRVIGLAQVMAREFKPVRFFVMMAAAAFVVCGVTAFYTHRAAFGRTAEERAGYAIGLKV